MMDVIPLNAQTKAMVMSIMNEEHSDAMRLYVRHYGQTEATSAELVDLDESQVHLSYTNGAGEAGQRLSMPYRNQEGEEVRVQSVGDCRRALVGMARVASEALGEPIDLPGSAPQRDEDEPSEEEIQEMMRDFQEIMMAKGKGKGASASSAPSAPSSGIRTLHDGGAGGGGGPGDMMAMMEAMLAMKGKGKGKGAEPALDTRFQGEGSRLGSAGDDEATKLANSEELAQQTRGVDTSKPVVKLRVRLLNRKTVEAELNADFTVKEVRAWLETHHAESFDRAYHLMDGAGFPPKKLADFDATLESLGLAKAGSCLECRPA